MSESLRFFLTLRQSPLFFFLVAHPPQVLSWGTKSKKRWPFIPFPLRWTSASALNSATSLASLSPPFMLRFGLPVARSWTSTAVPFFLSFPGKPVCRNLFPSFLPFLSSGPPPALSSHRRLGYDRSLFFLSSFEKKHRVCSFPPPYRALRPFPFFLRGTACDFFGASSPFKSEAPGFSHRRHFPPLGAPFGRFFFTFSIGRQYFWCESPLIHARTLPALDLLPPPGYVGPMSPENFL